MKKTIQLFTAVLILISSSAFANGPVVDQTAPNFTLTDINGKKVSLADFKGKVVVLEWVNFDCPFVKKHYGSGNMQSIQKTYTDKNVIWLSICSSASGKEGNYSAADVKTKIKERNATPTHYLLDENGSVGKLYAAKTTPHMFIINKDGILVYSGAIDDTPSTDKEDIKTAKNFVKSALDAVISGKPVETKSTTSYGCSVKY